MSVARLLWLARVEEREEVEEEAQAEAEEEQEEELVVVMISLLTGRLPLSQGDGAVSLCFRSFKYSAYASYRGSIKDEDQENKKEVAEREFKE